VLDDGTMYCGRGPAGIESTSATRKAEGVYDIGTGRVKPRREYPYGLFWASLVFGGIAAVTMVIVGYGK
jgi:hypothetical protein